MWNIGIYCTLGREYFPRPPASGNIPTLGTIYTDIPLGRVEYLVYILYVCTQKNCNWGTRDLNYLKFVATDFSPKIISPSADETSGDLA